MDQREIAVMAGVALALLACLYIYKELQSVKSNQARGASLPMEVVEAAEIAAPEKTE